MELGSLHLASVDAKLHLDQPLNSKKLPSFLLVHRRLPLVTGLAYLVSTVDTFQL